MNPGARLRLALDNVAGRFRLLRLWKSLAICWTSWALVGGVMVYLVIRLGPPPVSMALALGVFALMLAASALVCVVWSFRSARDPRWVAQRIESKYPDLNAGLLSALEEVIGAQGGRMGFLQTTVVREALEHGMLHKWDETVPTRKLQFARFSQFAALTSLGVVGFALGLLLRSHAGDPQSWTGGGVAGVKVEPGTTELERGAPLLVVARFEGAVPADAYLIVEGVGGGQPSRQMIRSLEDPAFAGRIEAVDKDLTYRVEYDGTGTEAYQVHVFEFPELVRTDARLTFPSYTSLEPKTVEDIRHVTAVEGTELTLLCRLNKDVASAKLVSQDGKIIDLTRDESADHIYRATLELTDPTRFRVNLVDKDGRKNKLSTEIVVNVTRNLPPIVKITRPSRDVRVSPVEELQLKAQLEDDYGVTRHGLALTMPSGETKELVLGTAAKSARKIDADHLIDFEALKAEPDQLLTYHFWAEDIGPNGQPRRSSGDLFFAEVRHFEEIFRQGEQPPEGSAQEEEQEGNPGDAQQADKLGELQKEVINATWKLIRRETYRKPTDKFVDDAKVIRESQAAVIEQAGQLGGRLRDAASKASLEQATAAMKNAEKELAKAAEGSSIPALQPALAAEQSAYQALMKLRAREFQVIRNNSRRNQRSASGGGSASDRQLQQLELTNDENRYEEQRSAKARQDASSKRETEQRETRQVLNRLHELAQRQNDLNQRLKELQSALEAAATKEAREDIERQLKRLRDQQQQILRDADEVTERMEQEENRARMAEARAQMEQSRQNVRQASEALERGQIPQALTAGTRAGRQLNEIREQVRKNASDRFSEEMTEMRERAKRLDEDQKKLADQIELGDKSKPQPGLRDGGQREQVNKGLDEQQKRLDELLDQMRRTVEDAEQTEPLLAKGLYDTVKTATDQKIPEALKVARQLVDLGITEEAAKTARMAGTGLEQLRQGVERAARSLLGDETAALKRAQTELEDLAEQVNQEIAQATGTNPDTKRLPGQRAEPNAPQGSPTGSPPADGQNPEQRDRAAGTASAANPGRENASTRAAGARAEPAKTNTPPQPRRLRGGEQPRENAGDPRGQGDQSPQASDPGQRDAQKDEGQAQGQPQQPGSNGNRENGGESRDRQNGGQNQGGGGNARQIGGPNPSPERGPGGPITGENFRQWSDRMRDVEELVTDPELRAEAARIRDRARGAREDYKRHSKVPDWTKLQTLVAQPINELRDRLAEEIRRRESPDSLVPIDRDPVPPQFAEGVRRYYERLGSGR
jgi:hypothetical protein